VSIIALNGRESQFSTGFAEFNPDLCDALRIFAACALK
jgi:hypothetical protein